MSLAIAVALPTLIKVANTACSPGTAPIPGR